MARIRRAQGRRARSAAQAVAVVAVGLLVGCGGGAPGATDQSAPAGGPEHGDAPAATQRAFRARLEPLNGSGVEGDASLSLVGSTLRVQLTTTGLEPRQEHVQHVHRLESGKPGTCPTPAADEDGDGMLGLDESLPSYGPVAMKLDPFPRADRHGRVSFQGTFQLSRDVEPLSDRVVVVYGLDLNGVYDPTVPVACGEIV